MSLITAKSSASHLCVDGAAKSPARMSKPQDIAGVIGCSSK